ncbi:hypothetical protein [Streptomyces axinellae]|uniref:Transposase n=1 Tax=Streptomyces axinellae TaxID=552788 RepID=A0ABP6CX27_9ACTN
MSRPDYAKIERLERELGIGDPKPPRRAMREIHTVCLTKNCGGDTDELHTWGRTLTVRIHTCE